jgi:glucose-1-phosphate thymidylyltransferase
MFALDDATAQESHLKVVIPLAGKGTRLRPHTHVTPKPLLRVGGRPVMAYILDDLQRLGVDEIVFITGHLKEKVQEYIETEYPGIRAQYVEQKVQDGTAGAVSLARPFIDSELLIIFVDTLFDADLTLVRRLEPDEAGVIWAKEVEDYQRFGVIVHDAERHMQKIVEKPSEPVSKLANIGLYYIRDWKLLFEGVEETLRRPPGKSGEYYLTDAFQYMIDNGARIRVETVDGWYDGGQRGTLLETNLHLLEHGRSLVPESGTGVQVNGPVRVAPDAVLENVEIGPNVTIESGCTVRNSRLRDVIVGRDAVIEAADLHDSLIGDRVELRHVHGEVSLGDDAVVNGNG